MIGEMIGKMIGKMIGEMVEEMIAETIAETIAEAIGGAIEKMMTITMYVHEEESGLSSVDVTRHRTDMAFESAATEESPITTTTTTMFRSLEWGWSVKQESVECNHTARLSSLADSMRSCKCVRDKCDDVWMQRAAS